jgi:hypothetical protein
MPGAAKPTGTSVAIPGVPGVSVTAPALTTSPPATAPSR